MEKYEKILPAQYTEAAHVRFDDIKTGFLSDLKAVLPGILMTVAGCILVRLTLVQILTSFAIFAVSVYPYFSLHEIIHGSVIKVMTGQNVKIGFGKSGAYCAMPDLYINRKTAILCTAAPLVIFSMLFGVCALALIFQNCWVFLTLSFLLSLHLLGCRSDVNLLKELKKHNDPLLLVKDAGTEQWFYSARKND